MKYLWLKNCLLQQIQILQWWLCWFTEVVKLTELGGRTVNIQTDVICKDIALLLNKNEMKRAQAVLDFKNDSILLFGQKTFILVHKLWSLLYTTN